MTAFVQFPGGTPSFSPIVFPALQSLSLTEAERAEITWLQQRAFRDQTVMRLSDSYYRGMQVVTNLGIAIPPELALIRTIVGWPKQAVDPLVERLAVDELRLPGATDANQDLMDIWEDNELDAEQSLAYLDALIMGRSWITVNSPIDEGDSPIIAVESPLNMSVRWDTRSLLPRSALQTYWADGSRHAAFYTPEQTVTLGEDDKAQWQVLTRDEHNFGFVPVVRLSNRQTSGWRDGTSEISAALMSLTDGACRTVLGMEVAREFYSVPQKIILGASESDFQSSDGTTKSAWDAYINKVLALERDEDGNLPAVQQFTPYDPSVFTKILDWYASQAASEVGAPAQDMGLYTQGNPVSAEAANVSESRRDRLARHKQRAFGGAWKRGMQMAVRFMNGGDLPDEFKRISVDWADPALPNLTGMADAISKYTAAGVWVAGSDVTLKKSGLSQIERERMEQDRAADAGASVLAELAKSVTAREARVDKSIANTINPVAAKGSSDVGTASGNSGQ